MFRFLWLYHFTFSLFYYFYTLSHSADQVGYWRTPKLNTLEECINYPLYGLGTKTMYVLNYFPSGILDLSFITGNILYSLIGFIGFVLFYKLVKDNIKEPPRVFGISVLSVILFFPNFHFWTANAGKDTILFFSIILIIYFSQKEKLNILIVLIGFILVSFVRPYVFALLLIAYAIAFLFDRGLSKNQKVILASCVLIVFLMTIQQVLDFVRLETLSAEALQNYSKQRVEFLSGGTTGSSVDMNSYFFPFKIFTFLYRPLFIDSPNALGLVSSVENLVLLIITIMLLKKGVIRNFTLANYTIKASFYFFILGTIMFSFTLGNLGIMLRMKNMLLPSFILVVCYLLSYKTYNIEKK